MQPQDMYYIHNIMLNSIDCQELQLDSSITSYYNNTCSEILLTFWCKAGWSPNEQITSGCTTGRQWTPDPFDHICNGDQHFLCIIVHIYYIVIMS